MTNVSKILNNVSFFLTNNKNKPDTISIYIYILWRTNCRKCQAVNNRYGSGGNTGNRKNMLKTKNGLAAEKWTSTVGAPAGRSFKTKSHNYFSYSTMGRPLLPLSWIPVGGNRYWWAVNHGFVSTKTNKKNHLFRLFKRDRRARATAAAAAASSGWMAGGGVNCTSSVAWDAMTCHVTDTRLAACSRAGAGGGIDTLPGARNTGAVRAN